MTLVQLLAESLKVLLGVSIVDALVEFNENLFRIWKLGLCYLDVVVENALCPEGCSEVELEVVFTDLS
jgi:hypothetical protein